MVHQYYRTLFIHPNPYTLVVTIQVKTDAGTVWISEHDKAVIKNPSNVLFSINYLHIYVFYIIHFKFPNYFIHLYNFKIAVRYLNALVQIYLKDYLY